MFFNCRVEGNERSICIFGTLIAICAKSRFAFATEEFHRQRRKDAVKGCSDTLRINNIERILSSRYILERREYQHKLREKFKVELGDDHLVDLFVPVHLRTAKSCAYLRFQSVDHAREALQKMQANHMWNTGLQDPECGFCHTTRYDNKSRKDIRRQSDGKEILKGRPYWWKHDYRREGKRGKPFLVVDGFNPPNRRDKGEVERSRSESRSDRDRERSNRH